MLFASIIFLFGFLPIFLSVYYLLPNKFRSLWILVASYAFYGWWRVEYLLVVIGISLISYMAASKALSALSKTGKLRAVQVGVALDLALLGYFKYAYFFTEAAGEVSLTFGGPEFSIAKIILPIGISFLTFQSISYILDVARKDAPPARNLIDFLAFSSLFPQLIAGPVLRYKDLADQFEHRTHSIELFYNGCQRFVTGLAMKILVADTVAPLADRMFALQAPTLTEAWLGAAAYSIQLLFDFAGYSAMAIGLGLMIGFRFVENFDAPYVSRSITEFWRRWHISLSNWLRDYLYIPLGGNRGGTVKTYRNLMLTMVLGGFWHGANWTFLFWGAWHGLLLSMERMLKKQGATSPWPVGFQWVLTMTFVLLGWVMFRAATVGEAVQMYLGMVGRNGFGISAATAYQNQPTEFFMLVIGGVIACKAWRVLSFRLQVPAYFAYITPVATLLSCTMILNARAHSPFLYFQF